MRACVNACMCAWRKSSRSIRQRRRKHLNLANWVQCLTNSLQGLTNSIGKGGGSICIGKGGGSISSSYLSRTECSVSRTRCSSYTNAPTSLAKCETHCVRMLSAYVLYVYICIYMYIYVYIYIVYIHTYIHTNRVALLAVPLLVLHVGLPCSSQRFS